MHCNGERVYSRWSFGDGRVGTEFWLGLLKEMGKKCLWIFKSFAFRFHPFYRYNRKYNLFNLELFYSSCETLPAAPRSDLICCRSTARPRVEATSSGASKLLGKVFRLRTRTKDCALENPGQRAKSFTRS
jgi:hypothetical protein